MATLPLSPQEERSGWIVRLVLSVGVLALCLALFRPFVSPLLWAAVLCYSLYPAYNKLVRMTGNRRAFSALVMCLVLTLGIIVPLVYLSFLIAEDLSETYQSLVAWLQQREEPLFEGWRDYPLLAAPAEALQNLERLTGTDLRSSLVENLTDLGRVLVEQVTRLATNVLYAVVQLGMILLCAFYLFRDGDVLIEWLRATIPLAPDRQRLLGRRFDDVVKGAVYGNTVIALLEGVIGGVAFWIVGLPSPLLWGAAMAILAYLPLVGAGLIWLPAAAYLFWQGAYAKVAVLTVTGVILAVVDYLVRTIVVGGRSRLHTLLVFFSVLGGLGVFGLVGIIAGPLVVAVGITLVETLRSRQPAEQVAPEP